MKLNTATITDLNECPQYTVAIDEEGRAWQLVMNYFHDELRWSSWVESDGLSGYTASDLLAHTTLRIVYQP